MAWLWPLAVIGGIAAWWRAGQCGPPKREHLALWAGWTLCYGAVFSAAGGLFHAYYLVVMAPVLAALAGIGVVSFWSLYAAGGARALGFPAILIVTALWQAHIVDGYLDQYLAIGRGWLVPALIAATGLAVVGLVAVRPKRSAALAGIAVAVLLAMPAAWSIGSVLAPGNTGFPAARPPFLKDAAEFQRGRWAQVVGALASDPKLVAIRAAPADRRRRAARPRRGARQHRAPDARHAGNTGAHRHRTSRYCRAGARGRNPAFVRGCRSSR